MRRKPKEIIRTYKETGSVTRTAHILGIHRSNENAVIERSFRTYEEEFIYRKAPFSDYDDLRWQYTEWLHWYNHKRPHLGIDLLTPVDKLKSVANVVKD